MLIKYKTFFVEAGNVRRISPDGFKALKQALEIHNRVWEGISEFSLYEAHTT